MRGRDAHATVRGLTLFEVVLSIALISMLLGALLTFFWQTLAVRDEVTIATARTQLVRQVLARMAAELKQTVAAEQVSFEGLQQFTGDRRRISFLTTPLPPSQSYVFYSGSETVVPPRHDLVQVTYELWIDPNEETEEGEPLVGGLLRTERQAINPARRPEEIPETEYVFYERRDLISPEVGYLEFRFFDGAEWVTQWSVSKGNALPHLLQITIGFDSLLRTDLEDQDLQQYPLDQYPLGPDVADPNRFSTIVRLPAADETFAARTNRADDQAEEVYQWGPEEGAEGAGGIEGTGEETP